MSKSTSNKVALIVDDDEMDQYFHQKTIKESGAFDGIKSFHYADDALNYFRDETNAPIDVIFLDINMPRMDGFEFLEAAYSEFGNSFAKMVVVMVTSSLDPRDLEKSKKFGVIRDYINKPLSVEVVLKVADLLED
ncbi:MAG: response regulator [Rhizobiaceae bacterium]|nr:response regulator [Rhizobiaceae bacterium]